MMTTSLPPNMYTDVPKRKVLSRMTQIGADRMILSDLKDKLLKIHHIGEDDYIEKVSGAYVIRSSFYIVPRTMEEIIGHLISLKDGVVGIDTPDILLKYSTS